MMSVGGAVAQSASMPDQSTGTWSPEQDAAIELLLDGFFAEPNAARRVGYFHQRLSDQSIGLTLDDLERMRRAEVASDRKLNGAWLVECDWLGENERGFFMVALPTRYDPARRYPLVVVLHGPGQTAKDAAPHYLPHLTEAGCIVLLPTTLDARDLWHAPDEVSHVYRLMEWVARRYRIDFRRLGLTGYTSGATGTWSHLLMRPELWHGGAAVAGHPGLDRFDSLRSLRNLRLYVMDGRLRGIQPPPGTDRALAGALAEARKLGVNLTVKQARAASGLINEADWQAVCDWLAELPAGDSSVRPMILPPESERNLWQVAADPLGVEDDPTMRMIRVGRNIAARTVLDRRITEEPYNPRLLVLRAIANVPPLAQSLPDEPDVQKLQAGWGRDAERRALADLNRALAMTRGKGRWAVDFDTSVRLLIAKVWAKRFALVHKAPTVHRVRYYESTIEQLQHVLRRNPMHLEASGMINNMNRWLHERFERPGGSSGRG